MRFWKFANFINTANLAYGQFIVNYKIEIMVVDQIRFSAVKIKDYNLVVNLPEISCDWKPLTFTVIFGENISETSIRRQSDSLMFSLWHQRDKTRGTSDKVAQPRLVII